MLGTATYTVQRAAAGDYVDGRYVPGDNDELTVEASVQPISGRELQRLEEGERERITHKAYSTAELMNGDVIEVDGDAFEVERVEKVRAIIPHFKAYLVRRKESL